VSCGVSGVGEWSGICRGQTGSAGCVGQGGCGWWVCWLVFENCIVDASIFEHVLLSVLCV
jgi:hypothetical protein